jgi:hypothetical protein
MPKNVCQWDGFSGNRTWSLRVHHTTIITWVKAVGKLLPEADRPEVLPAVAELDELEIFVFSKKNLDMDSGLPLQGWNFKLGIRSS